MKNIQKHSLLSCNSSVNLNLFQNGKFKIKINESIRNPEKDFLNWKSSYWKIKKSQ